MIYELDNLIFLCYNEAKEDVRMELSCYGKKYGRLDQCRVCGYVDYCRTAKDCAPINAGNYDDFAFSESVADRHTPEPLEIEEEPKEFTCSQVCDILRRMIELEDAKIRDILRLKLSDPDISIAAIGRKYGVSKQAIHNYMKRAIAYCPELAVVLCNRPMYNKWRKNRNIRIFYPKRKPQPFCEQLPLPLD